MRKLVFIFVLSALASTSNAALISTDLYSQGDGLLTLDTDTGLEWLDQSVCVSYTLAEINQCGLPSGFRTVADSGGGDNNLEIRTFLEHAGVDDFKFARTSGGTNNTYQAYQQLLSLTYFSPTSSNTILGVNYLYDTMPFYIFIIDNINEIAYVELNAALAVHPEYSLESIALVRTVVPIPAAVWLFGSGIVVLVGVTRRKAHA